MPVEVSRLSALCDDDYEFLLGVAIVGDPDRVLAKLRACQALGIEAFILSGYPHAAECDLFARQVLPRLDHGPLRPAGDCA